MKQQTLIKRLESLLNTCNKLNLELAKFNMRLIDTTQYKQLLKELKNANQ